MMAAVLSPKESTRLEKCEAVIERGLQTFVEVGNALLEIRDSRLYRHEFATFEDYCRDQWQMSRRHVNRLIASAEVAGNLGPIGPIPQSESQIRPLTGLEPEEQREAWNQAVNDSSNGKPTAKDVGVAVDQLKAPSKSDYPPIKKVAKALVEEFSAIIYRRGLGCAISFRSTKGEVDDVIETECGWRITAIVDRGEITVNFYRERNRHDERINRESTNPQPSVSE